MRSGRSTQAELAGAERNQSEVIAALVESGHDDIVQRLARCQRDRQNRRTGRYPWRCRGPGCWACRRTLTRRWWEAFADWLGGGQASPSLISIHRAPIRAVPELRYGLT